jgi:hypothetical protein
VSKPEGTRNQLKRSHDNDCHDAQFAQTCSEPYIYGYFGSLSCKAETEVRSSEENDYLSHTPCTLIRLYKRRRSSAWSTISNHAATYLTIECSQTEQRKANGLTSSKEEAQTQKITFNQLSKLCCYINVCGIGVSKTSKLQNRR